MIAHGGDLDRAMARWGGAREDWLDLSTGINPRAPALPLLPPHAWTALPTRAEMAGLAEAAARAYGAPRALPLAGASQAIGLIPRLSAPGRARVLGPTYGEHAATLRAAGWQVEEVPGLADLEGADLAVAVNPNNPDGRRHAPEALMALAARVGRLVVDESFADPHPELSVAALVDEAPLVVQRSFGKFYGLAGLRLGFAVASREVLAAMADIAGPWPVAGPAIHAGAAILAGEGWRRAETARLRAQAARLEALGRSAGWGVIGGCALFVTFRVPDGTQERLAQRRIWSRTFPDAPGWLRLGLPGEGWERLEAAVRGLRAP